MSGGGGGLSGRRRRKRSRWSPAVGRSTSIKIKDKTKKKKKKRRRLSHRLRLSRSLERDGTSGDMKTGVPLNESLPVVSVDCKYLRIPTPLQRDWCFIAGFLDFLVIPLPPLQLPLISPLSPLHPPGFYNYFKHGPPRGLTAPQSNLGT